MEVSPKRRRQERWILDSHWSIKTLMVSHWLKMFYLYCSSLYGWSYWELKENENCEIVFFCEQYNLMWSTFQFPPSEMRGWWIETSSDDKIQNTRKRSGQREVKELNSVRWNHSSSITRDLVSDAQWCVSKKTIRNSAHSTQSNEKAPYGFDDQVGSDSSFIVTTTNRPERDEVTAHFAPLPILSLPPLYSSGQWLWLWLRLSLPESLTPHTSHISRLSTSPN